VQQVLLALGRPRKIKNSEYHAVRTAHSATGHATVTFFKSELKPKLKTGEQLSVQFFRGNFEYHSEDIKLNFNQNY
jgi:hypothetical protein